MPSKDELEKRESARLLECLDKLDNYENDLDTWTDSLRELAEIEDAFQADERSKLHGKTILDIGTDCVKPLYIALKFEPRKIIGINEYLSTYSFESDLEQKSKLLTKTAIHLFDCSFFDRKKLSRILRKEKEDKFDFVLVSKTLHHLRTGTCIAKKRDQKHRCRKDEECCIYEFEEQEIFKRLLELGKRVIVYEWFCPHDKDDDKVRGRGGYFTVEEWKKIFDHLSEQYEVVLTNPRRCDLGKMLRKKKEEELDKVLRQVDCICFYVEAK